MRLGADRAAVPRQLGYHLWQRKHRGAASSSLRVGNDYRDQLQAGLRIAGTNPNDLVEIIEIPEHPWFVAVQFHPEFKSKPNAAHPLFANFIAAALKYKK